jgi:hypothetical protein
MEERVGNGILVGEQGLGAYMDGVVRAGLAYTAAVLMLLAACTVVLKIRYGKGIASQADD